jgi:predicted alpha/beta superfamily hydrolase
MWLRPSGFSNAPAAATRRSPETKSAEAEAFLSFVAGELVPYIEKNYRTRPYRLLVGHSFGGLFAVYAMIARPRLFNAYIAADPSLYWNNQAVVERAETFFANSKELQADLYMTAAGGSGEPDAGTVNLPIFDA